MTDVVPIDSQSIFVNDNGILTDIAWRYLDQIWRRTGGYTDLCTGGVSSGEELGGIGILGFGSGDDYEQPIIDSRVIELQKSLRDLSIDFEQIQTHRSLINEISKSLLSFRVVQAITTTIAQANYLYLCNGTFTVTLPPVLLNNQKQLQIKNVGTGIITIKGNAFETIEGENEQDLTVQYDSVPLVCDKTEWYVL